MIELTNRTKQAFLALLVYVYALVFPFQSLNIQKTHNLKTRTLKHTHTRIQRRHFTEQQRDLGICMMKNLIWKNISVLYQQTATSPIGKQNGG